MSRDNQGSWAFDPIKPGTFAVETIGFFLTGCAGLLQWATWCEAVSAPAAIGRAPLTSSAGLQHVL
ncbi:hypothetical protein [Rhizobium leguminosarum]|uniref:hypothetical protein n=1 Tax=Rhizobium leguminosarum TaxID=384 RepID=UPI001C959B02|nr:hypothetical protein [Rhizobium leguminosarum]MBY5808188.1 hypothetical protein [Rhizobium leguminosarum]